jgi:hypothetical protein
MNNKDRETIVYALGFWANYLETGDWLTSGQDLLNQKIKARPMQLDQMKKVIYLRELAQEVLRGKEESE